MNDLLELIIAIFHPYLLREKMIPSAKSHPSNIQIKNTVWKVSLGYETTKPYMIICLNLSIKSRKILSMKTNNSKVFLWVIFTKLNSS